MRQIIATGDKHGNYSGLKDFQNKVNLTSDDILIVLGDAGLNYDMGNGDNGVKNFLAKFPFKIICVHGNHEERAQYVPGYELIKSPFGEGMLWHNPRYPNQYFFHHGEYTIWGQKILVVGGAYSVDKFYRLERGMKWFDTEQLTSQEKTEILNTIEGKHYDMVLSHTCPTNYVPMDKFISGIEQSSVDRGMEEFLQTVHDNIEYDNWYCGHWHTDRQVDKLRFMFNDYKGVYYE